MLGNSHAHENIVEQRVLHAEESMSVSPSGGRHCCKQFSSSLKSIKQNLMTHFSKPFYVSVVMTVKTRW